MITVEALVAADNDRGIARSGELPGYRVTEGNDQDYSEAGTSDIREPHLIHLLLLLVRLVRERMLVEHREEVVGLLPVLALLGRHRTWCHDVNRLLL